LLHPLTAAFGTCRTSFDVRVNSPLGGEADVPLNSFDVAV
jgi:hypothetical protein